MIGKPGWFGRASGYCIVALGTVSNSIKQGPEATAYSNDHTL